MLATALFLISSPKFAVVMLCWLLGVGLVAGLFLANRRRIKTNEKGM